MARLVALLAPWERARLRRVCRTLAGAVPVAACAPSLASMVRARGGGAALLRYGAGDARPCWAHAFVAVEADAADALRWMLHADTGLPEVRRDAQRLARLAVRVGSAAAWRILCTVAAAGEADDLPLILLPVRTQPSDGSEVAPPDDDRDGDRETAPATHARTTALKDGGVMLRRFAAADVAADAGGKRMFIMGTRATGMCNLLIDLMRYNDRRIAPVYLGPAALMDAMRGGSESIAAEIAASVAETASACSDPVPSDCLRAIDAAPRYDMPAVLEPFLRPGSGHALQRHAAMAAFVLGQRPAAADDGPVFRGHPIDLRSAMRAGDVAFARVLLWGRVCHRRDTWSLLADAAGCRRNARATLDWVVAAFRVDARELLANAYIMLNCSIDRDACDALRWLVERTYVATPVEQILRRAIEADAAECAEYLAGRCGRPTLAAFADAMQRGKHRAAAVLARRLRRLDGETFAGLVRNYAHDTNEAGMARMVAMLRRRALLPAPGMRFLEACARLLHTKDELGVLVMAGYRVDADACAWLESLRPHCAGTPGRRWRRVGLDLHARWHA